MAVSMRILVAVLTMFIAVVSHAEPPHFRSIRVVMDNNYPPFAFQDGKGELQGVLVDQWRLWEEKTGIKAEITGMNWGEAQRRMQAGDFDVIDTIFRNKTRDQIYDFSRPYATIDFNLFFHKDISGIRNAQDVKGFVVGVKTGGAVIDVLKQHGVENTIPFDTDEKLVEAVRDDKIKVFALGHFSGLYFLNKFRLADRFHETAPIFTGEFHRAVRKGNGEILRKVEEGFAAITPVEYREIDKRWYGSGIGGGFPLRYLGYAAAAAGCVIIFLLTWNRVLNRAVKLRTAEREDAIREIEGQRALLTSIINGTNDAIFVKDTDGRYLMVNMEVERLFSRSKNDILGRDDRHFFPPEQAELLIAGDREIMSGNEVVTRDEDLQTVDGDRTYLATKGPIRGPDGTLFGLFGISRDITGRIQAEEALRRSEERYRSIIDTLQDVYFRSDAEGRMVMMSPSGAALLGYDNTDEMLGKTIRDTWYCDPAERDRLLAELRKKGSVSHYEVTLKRRDGSAVPVAVSSHLIADADGQYQGVEGIFRDMTENRLLQEEREKSQRLESLGVLAGGIAHDFNNILTGILGNVSLARRRIGDDHPASTQLAGCEKAAFRAAELTQQLLTFARGGAPVRQVVDTRQLLEESVSLVLHGSSVTGTLECPADTWQLDADPGQMSQVINNLLINATQAMPEGGHVTLTANNLTVHDGDTLPVRPGRYVRLLIADRGCGIPADQLPRIFDPYFTTKSGGTGLGLTSVFSIVKRHGGMVSASSVPGNGTIFTLLLPVAETVTARRAGDEEEYIPRGEGLVLLMDDEELILDLAKPMLEEIGYDVEICTEGSQAIALHRGALERGRRYSAIVLDLTVPGGMGGKEAAETIRLLDTDVPLIVSSGYSNEMLLDGTTPPLFDGSVKKPYTLQQLGMELARVVGKK